MFAALPSGPVRMRFAPTMRSKTLAAHRSVHPRRPFPSAPNLRTLHGRVAISAWSSWGATIILAVDEGAQTVSIIGVFYGGQDHEGALSAGWGDLLGAAVEPGRSRHPRRQRRPDLAVRHCDDGVALIAASASVPARPLGRSPATPFAPASTEGGGEPARGMAARRERDAGPLTAARREAQQPGRAQRGHA